MQKQKVALILLLGLCLIFLILSPKVSSLLFPAKRMMIWNNFISQVKKDNRIDGQKFWEFREFYYPGSFNFKHEGFSEEEIDNTVKEIGVMLKPDIYKYPFLIFTSGKIKSVEMLVQSDSLNGALQTIPTENIIWHNTNEYIYKINAYQSIIVFLKPTSEMVLANGFLSNRDKKDVDLYTGKHWLVISSITTD